MPIHISSVLLVIWLIIGGIAASQRGEFGGYIWNCSHGATIGVTLLAGPLNYLGVNPQIHCTMPAPSK